MCDIKSVGDESSGKDKYVIDDNKTVCADKYKTGSHLKNGAHCPGMNDDNLVDEGSHKYKVEEDVIDNRDEMGDDALKNGPPDTDSINESTEEIVVSHLISSGEGTTFTVEST